MNAFRASLISYVPLLSMFVLMLGSGLFGTLISLRIKLDQPELIIGPVIIGTELIIGIITSIFYLGMLIGSVQLAKTITKVGHVRAFSSFAAVYAISALAAGMKQDILVWALTRFFSGYSLAGLYITIESWILGLSNKANRGRYLALYMGVLYGGQASGQFFLSPANAQTITPFCIATILAMLSIIPMSVIVSKAPAIKEARPLLFSELYKISPTGVIGCVISGIIIASIYGMMPAYFKGIGYSVREISILMFYAICGGVLLQYPFGHISDFIDKRILLLLMCILGASICSAMIGYNYFSQNNIILLSAITFVFGGLIFSIYPVCMSHLCDYIGDHSIIEATKGLIIAYGIGSVTGPLVISFAMGIYGADALFVSFIIVMSSFAAIITFRLFQSKKTIHATALNITGTPESTYITPSKKSKGKKKRIKH